MTGRPLLFLILAHLVGNGLLLLLGYRWLGMGEGDAAHLMLSAVTVLLFTLGALWLHGTALVAFRRQNSLLHSSLLTARHLLPLFLLGLAVLVVYAALQHFYYSFGHEAFTIGSYSTMKLRRPVAPAKVLKAFHFLIWVLQWFVVPVLALPAASDVAALGWAGFHRSAFRRSGKALYWLETVFLAAAIYLPLHLFFWIPKVSSFSMEVVSVALRLGAGYLLFTGGLLALEFFTSSGSPRSTQLKTVVSP